jgi:uncharacterized protein (DUF427 family)
MVSQATLEKRMATAVWNGAVIAEAPDNETEVIGGNVYFPLSAVDQRYLQPSNTRTVCLWKGMASYYHVVVEGQENRGAAWYYPEPNEAARQIIGRIAFWRGVEVKRSLTG